MKRNTFKKVMAMALAAVMLFALAACGGDGPAVSDQPGADIKPFTIGYIDDGATDGAKTPLIEQLNVTIAALGGTAVAVAPESNTADSCIDALNILVSKGVDGVVLPNSFFSEANLPTIATICEKAGVYWGLYWSYEEFSADVQQILDQSEHFVGVAYQDDWKAGNDGMTALHEAGCSKIGYIGLPRNEDLKDNTRDKGIDDACAQYGMSVLIEQRDFAYTTSSEGGAKTIENFLTAYPEIDGIMIAGMSQYVLPGVMQSLATLGRTDVKVACIDFCDGMDGYAAQGQLIYECGGHNNGASYMAILIANEIQGTPLSDKAEFLPEQYIKLYTSEDFANYEKIKAEPTYTAEEIAQCLVKNNPDFDLEALVNMVKAYSIEDIMTRHGK